MPVPGTRGMLLPQGGREGQHAGERAQALEEPNAVVECNGECIVFDPHGSSQLLLIRGLIHWTSLSQLALAAHSV